MAFTMSSKRVCVGDVHDVGYAMVELEFSSVTQFILLVSQPDLPPLTVTIYYPQHLSIYVICLFPVVITTTRRNTNILCTVEPHPPTVTIAEREFHRHVHIHIATHKYTDSEILHRRCPEDQNHSKTHPPSQSRRRMVHTK